MNTHSVEQLQALLGLSDEMLAALGEGDWAGAIALDQRRQQLLNNPAGMPVEDDRQRQLLESLHERNEALAALAARMQASAAASLRDIKAGARATEAYAAV